VITWVLISEEVPPTKFGMAKNVQNSARFLKTSDFERECLPNGSTRKSEKCVINYNPSAIGRKIGELWSTYKKSYRRQK